MFVIYDTAHFEIYKQFSSHGEALQELERLALLRGDAKPNLGPCGRACRIWSIIECDTSTHPWKYLGPWEHYLDISPDGARWLGPILQPSPP